MSGVGVGVKILDNYYYFFFVVVVVCFRVTFCFYFPSRTEDLTLNARDKVLDGVHKSALCTVLM